MTVTNKPFKQRAKARLRAWGKRFLLAEVCGAALAVIAAFFTNHLSRNAILAAYAGAVAETIGFYTPIVIQDSLAMRRELHNGKQTFGWKAVLQLVKNMLLEFGPAELLDSAFLRPVFMYYMPILLHNYPLGILAGKLAGDVAFYIPVTFSNRLRAILTRNRP